MISWIEKLVRGFGFQNTSSNIPLELPTKTEVKPELSPFEKILKSFDKQTDLLVVSTSTVNRLTAEQLDWIDSLGDKVIYLQEGLPNNIAIIKAGLSRGAWGNLGLNYEYI